LILEFLGCFAGFTKGEDHLPEVAFSSSSLLLQILNSCLTFLDSSFKLILNDKKDIVEIVGSFGTVFLELFQDLNNGFTFCNLHS
jgi:hypothetical protein